MELLKILSSKRVKLLKITNIENLLVRSEHLEQVFNIREPLTKVPSNRVVRKPIFGFAVSETVWVD